MAPKSKSPASGKPRGIGTSKSPHPLVAELLSKLKGATLVGAHGKPGAGPNAKGELLVKLDNATVAYVSLAAKGTLLHAERSTLGLSETDTPVKIARAIVRQVKLAAANSKSSA